MNNGLNVWTLFIDFAMNVAYPDTASWYLHEGVPSQD